MSCSGGLVFSEQLSLSLKMSWDPEKPLFPAGRDQGVRHRVFPPLEFQGEKLNKCTPSLCLAAIYFSASSWAPELLFPEEQHRPSPWPWPCPMVSKFLLLSPEDSQVSGRVGVISYSGEHGTSSRSYSIVQSCQVWLSL